MKRVRTSDPVATLVLFSVWLFVLLLALFGASQAHASGASTTLAVLESFPVHVTDAEEPEEKRSRRLREIATAIDAATDRPTERAALLTIVRFESGAAAYVHEDRCADGPRGKLECDSGQAVGHWQLHGEVPSELGAQASKAVALWRFGLSRCRRAHPDPIAGAFQSFGTGGKCSPSAWSKKRADTMRRIVERL